MFINKEKGIVLNNTSIFIKYNGKDIDEINTIYKKVDSDKLDDIFSEWYTIFKSEELSGEELINHKLVEEFDSLLLAHATSYIKSLKIDVIPKTKIPKHIYGKEAFELYLYMFRVRLLRPFVSLLTSVFGIGHIKFVPETIKGPEELIKQMISEGSQAYSTVCPDFEFNKLMAKGGKPLTNHPLSYIFTSLYKAQRKTFIVPSDEESNTTDSGIVDVGPSSSLPVGRLEEIKYACALERLMEFYEIEEEELPSEQEMFKISELMNSKKGLLLPDITEMFVQLLLKEYLTNIEYDREMVFDSVVILISLANKYNIGVKNFILPVITSYGTPVIGPIKVDCFLPLQQKTHQYVRNNSVGEVEDVFGCVSKISTLEPIVLLINKIIEIAKNK